MSIATITGVMKPHMDGYTKFHAHLWAPIPRMVISSIFYDFWGFLLQSNPQDTWKNFSFYFNLVTDCQSKKLLSPTLPIFIRKSTFHEAKNPRGSYTWNALGMVHYNT